MITRKDVWATVLALWVIWIFFPDPSQSGPVYRFRAGTTAGAAGMPDNTVIGTFREHEVAKGDTLLDIARAYGLGINEMEDLYPEIDPWVLKTGERLTVPSRWILPEDRKPGIVINVPEMRLYHFPDASGRVRTYPVAVGQPSWPSPVGNFRVMEKRVNPAWYIPASLQEKYGAAVRPPGPDNPLGQYFMGIGDAVGIHGTDFAWSVGRLVTHGCIRLYPEDIKELFPEISLGTPVRIIYEPVKIGRSGNGIYVEAHRDVYEKMSDYRGDAFHRISEAGFARYVDPEAVEAVLEKRSGVPVEVGRLD